MFILEDIKQEIEQLSPDDRDRLLAWIRETGGRGYRVEEAAVSYSSNSDIFSVEEYLRLEENSEVRHEYFHGSLFAMSGASLRHDRIATNLLAAFHGHVRGGSCVAHSSDVKLSLSISDLNIFYYPDVMVSCTREGEERNYIRNPRLVIEVLSPSTSMIDRREKLMTYKQIPTVEEYMVLSQDTYEVVAHRRADKWVPQVIKGADAIVEFRSIGLSLPLTQVYEGLLQ
jgi:Uma2 family endonuclease